MDALPALGARESGRPIGSPEPAEAPSCEGRLMTIRERVAAFLDARSELRLCDVRLGRALQIHPASAHRAAIKLAGSHVFTRDYRPCVRCGEARLTTGASSSGVVMAAKQAAPLSLLLDVPTLGEP